MGFFSANGRRTFARWRRRTGAQFDIRKEFEMALTDYITLGRSGLRVSPLALGTMTFGTDWG